MPFLFRGSTIRPLCESVIRDREDVIGFSAFLPRWHRLALASDAVIHGECYAAWPSRTEFEALFARFKQIWHGSPRKMSIALMNRWDVAASEMFNAELEAIEELRTQEGRTDWSKPRAGRG